MLHVRTRLMHTRARIDTLHISNFFCGSWLAAQSLQTPLAPLQGPADSGAVRSRDPQKAQCVNKYMYSVSLTYKYKYICIYEHIDKCNLYLLTDVYKNMSI